MTIENSLWCESHRPQNLETYIGNEHIKAKIQTFIDEQDVPHLLLAGRAGTGKTTLAKMLVKNIDCDHLFINASDENSIDTIRNKIKGFVTTMGFKSLKIVILDEADYITPNGQAALRNLMETFSKTSRFILTCNFQERIIEPIISRCQTFNITPPSQKDIAVHLANILQTESVNFSPEDIKQLVVTYHPDIRKIINTAQLFSKDNQLTLDTQQLVGSDVKLNIMELLMGSGNITNRFKQIRELVHKHGMRDYAEVFSFIYENIEEFSEDKQPMIIMEVAEAQHKDAFVVDKEINFAAMVYKILKIQG
tara:strand:- start:1099 stop:2022 length:924 start_codon:yes stop_codon:yes gene_type:complete